MPEVQNVGAVDYAQQYQPAQSQDIYNDTNSVPQIYDEELESKRAASSSMKGLAILGTLILAGVGFGCYKWGGKSASAKFEDAAAKLEEIQHSEAVKNYGSLKESFGKMKDAATQLENKMKNAATELEKDADSLRNKFFGGLRKGKSFAQKVKDIFIKPCNEQSTKIEEIAKEAEKKMKEAAEEAEKFAKEAAE